jgi:hypothetical protein
MVTAQAARVAASARITVPVDESEDIEEKLFPVVVGIRFQPRTLSFLE